MACVKRTSSGFADIARDVLATILFLCDTPRLWVELQGVCKQLYGDMHSTETSWGMANAIFNLTASKMHEYLRAFLSDKKDHVLNVRMAYEAFGYPCPQKGSESDDSDDSDNEYCVSEEREKKRCDAIRRHRVIFEEVIFVLLWQCPIQTLTIVGGNAYGFAEYDNANSIIEAISLPTSRLKHLFIEVSREDICDNDTKKALLSNPRLESLKFAVNKLGKKTLKCLQKNTKLLNLDVSLNSVVVPEFIDYTGLSTYLPENLRKLVLSINDNISFSYGSLGDACAKILGCTCKLLTSFHISDVNSGGVNLCNFAKVLAENKTLKDLGLGINLSQESTHALAEVFGNHISLESIALKNCRFYPDEVIAIGKALIKNPKIKSLEFSRCNFADKGVTKLAGALSKLTNLTFNGNDFDGVNIFDIVIKAMQTGIIRTLILRDIYYLTIDDIAKVFFSLRENVTLRKLDLSSDSPISDLRFMAPGTEAALMENTGLMSLKFGNAFGTNTKAARYFAKLLAKKAEVSCDFVHSP